MRLRLVVGLTLAAVGWTHPVFCQTESLIQREIDAAVDESLWRTGPFLLTPRLRVDGGYDSNALSSADFPENDISFLLGPGLNAAVPMRNRALIELYDEVDFVYYRKLEQLRDIFNVVRVGGAFGGRRLLFRVEDELREEKTRPTSEFDIPVDQRSNRFTTSLTLAIGWRHELTLSYRNELVRIEDPEAEVDGTPVATFLDRRLEDYRVRLSRRMTAKTSGIFEGFRQIHDFQAAAGRDARSYGVLGGFSFTPRTNVSGEALVGFRRLVPDVETEADFLGLIGSVDVGLDLGRRFRVQVLFSRDLMPSILENNVFFIENRYGGSVELFIVRNFSIRPRVVLGRNTTPRPVPFVDDEGERGEETLTDRFESYSLSFNYRLLEAWTISLVGTYWDRDSRVRSFDKERFVLNLGISAAF